MPGALVALTGCKGSPDTFTGCHCLLDSWSILSREALEEGFLGKHAFLGRRIDICSLILQALGNSCCQYGTGEPAVLYSPPLSHSLHASDTG